MTEATTTATEGAARVALRETRQSLVSVFGNPAMRRVQLALAGSMIGDWAYSTAVAVWAYGVGGATAVGVWAAIRLTLMAFTAPVTAGLADRFPRKTVMVLTDLVRAVLIAINAFLLIGHAPAAPIFVLATVGSLIGTPFRAAQRSLMPSLARRPEELTASNGTSSTIESLAFFVGPAIGAALIGLTSISVVFFFDMATFLWSMVMVLGVRVPARDEDASGAGADGSTQKSTQGAAAGDPSPAEEAEPEKVGFVTETLAGFRTIFGNRDLLVTTVAVCAQTVVAGASAVFGLLIAVEILKVGPIGVGYLDSVLGVGAIVGGLWAISRASKRKLGQDMILGVMLWSLPLLLVTIAPWPVAAFAAMVLLGLANPLVDVNLDTIIQRITPDEVMGRVFGALEACLIATMAVGSLVMPVLYRWLGLRGALAVIAIVVAVVALAGLPRMRGLDARLAVPAGVPLLRAVPMFAPLTPAVVESLARGLTRVDVPAGQVVLREGDESDRFFVIESGEIEVTQNGNVLRHETAGDFFGEIGLLRDVPRTATITAVEDTVLQALDRADFLAAVIGENEARLAADDIVTRRLTV